VAAQAEAESPSLGGLSTTEVSQRVASGQVNRQPDRTSRTYREIVRANVLTRFNLIISALLIVVLAVGDVVDALFGGVMVVNAAVGIVQEVRAKRTLDRLRLLVAPRVTVLRDHVEVEVSPEAVVRDDLLILRPGDQVPVDGRVATAYSLEIDESALTGESDPVMKAEGDEVLSGSAVVAGHAVVMATRIGEDAWIHRLVTQAKAYQPATSELRAGVDRILRVVGWVLVPLAALLFWSQLRSNESTSAGLISAVAGVVGLVPQGLVLLVSMALAVAVVRLAKQHVVVQELHAVEGLARVDVFCVDKTGTLTTGSMQVESIEGIEGDLGVTRVGLAALAGVDPNPTATLRVIGESLAEDVDGGWVVEEHVPFSSERKWSGATFDVDDTGGDDIDTTWVIGAPEILLASVSPDRRGSIEEAIGRSATDARRVVMVASARESLAGGQLPELLTPRAIVELSEQIRPDAAATMAYFRRQNVTVKVISGDNPLTVSAVASQIGLDAAVPGVDMRLIDTDDPGFADLVERTTVFGRVLPEQKRAIVEALQRAGHRVAMTGDGVNDIPALKRADIGIAVDTATAATKAISQLVLLGGRFDRMPYVVAEGRRVIANMERVSALFVTKTVYATLFAVAIGLSGSVFPFLPRHMSLVSELTIGLPAFVLSFRAADEVCRPGYLRRVVRFAVPAGVATGTVALSVYWMARSPLGGATLEQARSVSTIGLVLFAFWVLYVLMRPTDHLDRLLLSALIVIFVAALAVRPIRNFYRLDWPPVETLIGAGVIVATSIVVSQIFVRVRAARDGR
jgi:magnesium-transporting ATPase (P-type)